MNSAQANRHLRSLNDPLEKQNEYKIQRIQASFGLDRTSAAQTLEWMELKLANTMMASGVGVLTGVYAHRRFSSVFRERVLLFRKPWIAPIIPLIGFYWGYLGAVQLRGRRFAGKDVDFEKMAGANDIVSRFRNMEVEKDTDTPSERISNYLMNSTQLSRSQLEKDVYKLASQGNDVFHNKTIKRLDKDTNDIYWWFGKIHGLENIAFVSDEELARTNGNPVKLQELVSKARRSGPPARNFDGLISHAMDNMARYKQVINQMTLNRSDRTKLLALPFFTQRRTQGPAPKKGMWQYDYFTELAGGKDWHHYDGMDYDNEKKITAYNFEKFLPASYLEHVDTSSPQFRKDLKMATLLQKTEYEKHTELKKNYRNLMNVLSYMNEDEGRSFIHLLKSKNKDYLNDIHGGKLEDMLSKIAEEEGYAAKNDYFLRKTKLDYMKKDDYPIEKTKVKDLFKNARAFKERFTTEIGIYDTLPRMIDYEKRHVQEFIRNATGPFLALRNEIGLDMTGRLSTAFLRAKDLKEVKEEWCDDPILDHGFYYRFNTQFLNLNMTDHEDVFVGPGEIKQSGGPIPQSHIDHVKTRPFFDFYNNTETKAFELIEDLSDFEPRLNFWRSTYEEENLAPEEDDDDDDEDEDDDEEGPYTYTMPEFAEQEYDEEEYEAVDWEPEMNKMKTRPSPSTFFGENEKLEDKYEDIELDSFMKFLDVKPFLSWRDRAGYHNRLGMHTAEDFSQKVDPDYHIVAEAEREAFERRMFKRHRTGSTVRFVVDGSKPKFGKKID